jgi:mono/diheme cytochrome c family protein
MKIVLLVSSLVFLGFLLSAAFQENYTSEWRQHQIAYAQILSDAAGEKDALDVSYPIEVRQIYLAELQRIDRCVTCHVGIDNPTMHGQPIPLAAHPGDLLQHHPPDKFGCTICHHGQGRATSVADAHANQLNRRGHNAAHWEEPLLAGKMVYTSCGRCHYENDLYGGQSDLYGQTRPIVHISQGELAAGLPGADNLARGKRLVVEHGCLGCHQYRGRGGTLGPEITHVGDKTVHDLDFQHVHGERTVENWMFAHFKSPSAVVPNTVMPELGLTDDEAHDLAAYMISLKRKSAPAAYTPLPRDVDSTPIRGETLYQTYCAACHGANGIGAIVRDAEAARLIDRPRELLTPSLRNVDTLGVASDDFVRTIIAEGRPGTSMPAWKHQGGLGDDEIDLLVGYIRRWEPREAELAMISSSRGDARYGGALFRANCAGCHGSDGSGGQIGVSLRSASLLAVASDNLLATTILHGRPNTAMPSWRQFDNREVSDLLAWIRSWQPLRSNREKVLGSDVLAADVPPADHVATGETLYRSRCIVCHGQDGKGGIGPSLNNQSVLSIVSNAFLHDTLVRGRPGTAMPAWRQLSSEDVVDLIALLRSWQTVPTKELPDVHVTGDWQNGAQLYQGMCASCHGPDAQGAIGPQLINPVLLETVSDATLIQWISHGRTGTQMRPFLRGLQGAAELSPHQIEDIVTFLRYQTGRQSTDGQRIGIGYAPRGKALFAQACAGCHGPTGEGANGPAIRNPAFLAAASDGFLRATIVLGRDGTEMRSMGHHGGGIVEFRADEIDDLIAYLRTAEQQPQPAHRFVIGADPDRGHVLYSRFCAGCHGADGTDNFAPELNNPGFLRAATDGYLQATIIRGRRGTAMRPFGAGRHGLADLTQEQVNDIVSFIRQWSPDTRPLRRAEPFAEQPPTKPSTPPAGDQVTDNRPIETRR